MQPDVQQRVYLRSGAPPIEPEAVQRAMENEYDRQILAMAQTHEVSAQEIMDATDIPKSTVYRRLERLEDDGLLVVSGGTMQKGHPIDLYRSPLEKAALRIEEGHIDAEWRIEESPDERLYRLWTQLRED